MALTIKIVALCYRLAMIATVQCWCAGIILEKRHGKELIAFT